MSTVEFSAPPNTPSLIITCLFDAPFEQVFNIWTDPQLIPQWWGPAYLDTTVERMEVRTGGSYRILQRAPDGKVHGFHGVYHAIEAPRRIVATFEYEGTPGHVSLETTTFEAQETQTKYRSHTMFQSFADRDAMLQTNCEAGVRETMERMATLLAQRRTSP